MPAGDAVVRHRQSRLPARERVIESAPTSRRTPRPSQAATQAGLTPSGFLALAGLAAAGQGQGAAPVSSCMAVRYGASCSSGHSASTLPSGRATKPSSDTVMPAMTVVAGLLDRATALRLTAGQPRGSRPMRKNSSLGTRRITCAIRLDMAKNAVMAAMSQIASSSKPCSRSAAR